MGELFRILTKKYKRLTDREMGIIVDVYQMATGEVPTITDYTLLPDRGKLFDECDDVLSDVPVDEEIEAETSRVLEKLFKEKHKRSN